MKHNILFLRLLFIFAFSKVFFTLFATAQNSDFLGFGKTVHDFGTIREEKGKVDYTFMFRNNHDTLVTIVNVVAGCGCTASDFTQTPLAPGDTGYLQVTYTTTNRPGPFEQRVTVVTDIFFDDGTRFFKHIHVKGDVTPRVPTTLDNYPIGHGKLHFNTSHLSFDKIKNTRDSTLVLGLYNNWDKPMRLDLSDPPDFISYQFKPAVLEPDSEGKLYITYHAKLKGDYGLVFDQLTITTDDNDIPQKQFFISADIREDFSGMTSRALRNAPKIKIEKAEVSFDTISSGDVYEYTFHFSNTGKRPLLLRKITSSCACVTIEASSLRVEPQAEASIKAVFNSANRAGFQRHTITVITNAPEKPIAYLVLQGHVIPPR